MYQIFSCPTFPTHIWTANDFSNDVTMLRPSDGAVTRTFAVEGGALVILHDGRSIWVANTWTDTVAKIT